MPGSIPNFEITFTFLCATDRDRINHRITGWFGLEGVLHITKLQSPWQG